MSPGLFSVISSLNAVAMGDKPADLVLENCTLVNVYTREILPETQISIAKAELPMLVMMRLIQREKKL